MEADAGEGLDQTKMQSAKRRNRALQITGLLLFTATTIILLLLFLDNLKLPLHVLGTGAHKPAVSISAFNSRLRPKDHAFRDPKIVRHQWRVTKDFRRPDGVLKRVYLINDAFPGPTVEAQSGDYLIISVENALGKGEGLSIHWHGLHMRGANKMDGAVGVTQTPIANGENFTYEFDIDRDQHGTFWWHAHDGVQRADGLYGGLVIHEPMTSETTQHMADQHLLLVGDWYHRSAEDALEFYMHPGSFGMETVPDSLLVNGQGAFKCADAVPARPVDCMQRHPHNVRPLEMDTRKPNILKVVNVGAYTGLSFEMPGSSFTTLAVDGGQRVSSQTARRVGFLHPGERVDVLIDPEQITDVTSDLKIAIDDSAFKYENPALSLEHKIPVKWKNPRMNRPAKDLVEVFDLQNITSAEDQSHILSEEPHQTLALYTLTQKMARLDYEPHGFINHTRWLPQAPPLIDIGRSEWDEYRFVPHIPYDKDKSRWIDIVLNNLDEDSHPFHLHGNDFWVLASHSSTFNWGSYNPYENSEPPGGPFNLINPIKRDTYYVPRRGYAVLRFRADNPGIWMFHCHVLWHHASGMSMAFDVR